MRFIFSALTLFLCLSLNAQISITTSDMPSVGDTLPAYRDTQVPGFSIGQKGANRTWDFTNLQPDETAPTYVVAPSSTPYNSTFSASSFALTTDFNAYLYYTNSASALRVDGLASNDPNLGVIAVPFSPKPDQYRFPTTYAGAFSGNSGFVSAKPYNQLPQNIKDQIDAALTSLPGVSVTQVRVTFTSSYTDTIDAWGTVITPLGSYDALRRKRIENSTTIIEAELDPFIGQNFWYGIANVPASNTEHTWLSKETEIPLVSLGYDSLRNIISVTYAGTPPPPTAGFTWTNPSGGLVNFTNTSQNSPTSYSWDFGDSGSSTQQTPSHVYSANGTYYVCLTVTNASGSDTFCDSVEVTGITLLNNAPIANRDSVQIVYPATATIDALANDIDPDNGDIISYNIFFPALNGTVSHLGNGVFEYEANSGFRGIDSFFYKISDDGSPVKSDTGTVVIRVDGLPAADFTYSTSGFDVTFENISFGFDSVSWDLGDGATATTNTVVHTYARGSYNVCLTAYNASGSDDTCKTVDLTNVGVAGIESNGIKIYPNPATDKVMIEVKELNGEHTIALYNNIGKLVLQSTLDKKAIQLDLSDLSGGVYGIQIADAAGKSVMSKKLLIVE